MSHHRYTGRVSPWSCPHFSPGIWHSGKWIAFGVALLIARLLSVDTQRLFKQDHWPSRWSPYGWLIKDWLSAKFDYFAVWSTSCMGQLWIWSWSKCKFHSLGYSIFDGQWSTQNNYCITSFINGNADFHGLHLQLDHIQDPTLRPLDELFNDHFMQGLYKWVIGSRKQGESIE